MSFILNHIGIVFSANNIDLHAASLIRCENKFILVDSNFPQSIEYSIDIIDDKQCNQKKDTDELNICNNILQIYRNKGREYDHVKFSYICFIQKSALFNSRVLENIELNIKLSLLKLPPLNRTKSIIHKSEIGGGNEVLKKQLNTYFTYNKRTYCIYLGKYGKKYIKQKGQMVAVSSFKK